MHSPLIVAVFQPNGRKNALLRRIEQHLRRRGLHVQTLRQPENPIAPDSDVALIPYRCSRSARQAPVLASEIERLWAQHWLHWYKKRTPKQ